MAMESTINRKAKSIMKYQIIGIYKGNREVIDETDSKQDADYLVSEYRLAYGNEWKVYAIKTKGVN